VVSRSQFLEKMFGLESACYVVYGDNGNTLRFKKKILLAGIDALHCI
jgi:hypothetical protein